MAPDRVKAVLVEEDPKASGLKLGPLLIAGVAVYIAVTLAARGFVVNPVEFTDEEWIGLTGHEVVYYFGKPGNVEEDGTGAAILRYRLVLIKDEHYVVQEMTVNVDAGGRITDFKRE